RDGQIHERENPGCDHPRTLRRSALGSTRVAASPAARHSSDRPSTRSHHSGGASRRKVFRESSPHSDGSTATKGTGRTERVDNAASRSDLPLENRAERESEKHATALRVSPRESPNRIQQALILPRAARRP